MERTHATLETGVEALSGFMTQVYAWMTGGLLLSASVALFVVFNEGFLLAIADFIGIVFILQLLLVIGLSGLFNRLSLPAAALLFVLFALLNGLTLGVIVYAYSAASVFLAFGATGGTFLAMSLYGMVTKQDLTRFRSLFFMGLIGLVIGLVLNLFLASSALDWILTYFGIALFIGLIAYDTQVLKRLGEQAGHSGDYAKFAVIGALRLYLDFINLFIRLLHVFGRKH